MPYSIPRPIPSKPSACSSSNTDSQFYPQAQESDSRNFTAGSIPVLHSSIKRSQIQAQSQQQGTRRRRSSTIKSALSSLLGSSPPHQSQHHNHYSSSLPKNTSSLSVGADNTHSFANHSSLGPRLRRYSTTSVEPMPGVQGNSGSCTTNEEDEDAVVESLNDDTSLEDDFAANASTSGSSMSNPGLLTQSLKSLGKTYLSEYLTERGLLPAKTVLENHCLKVSLATSGDSVFLPTVSSNDDEYLARLNGLRNAEEASEDLGVQSDSINNYAEGNTRRSISVGRNTNISAQRNESQGANSENDDENRSTSSAGSNFEIDSSMATYTIAVILSITQPMTLSDFKTELCSRVRVYWPNGVPPSKTFHEEFYCAGNLNWDLNINNVNLFVPKNVSSKERIINNNTNLKQLEVFQNSNESRKRYLDKNNSRKQLLSKVRPSKNQLYQPGDYVFIIPVVFSNSIPESLYLPSARVNYRFRIAMKIIDPSDQQENANDNHSELASGKNTEAEAATLKKFTLFKKLKNNLHLNNTHIVKDDFEDGNSLYAEYPVNIVRTPPLYSISTANKPVYINRVWSDSLSYEISFSQKYVSLDSKVPIRIKVSPLVKNICLKRVRISVVEKITMVSKNCEYEYDQIDPVAKDPYNPYFAEFASKRKKERNVSLLEIRTKDKGSRAIREEIVNNCIDDNLLAYTSLKNDKGEDSLGVTEPLVITTNLEFPKYIDMDKDTARVIPPYGIDVYAPVTNPEISKAGNVNNRGGVIGFLAGRKNSFSTTTKTTGQSSHVIPPQHVLNDSRFHATTFRSDSSIPVEFQTRLNKAKRGLYLDSLHFSNIYSRHKLEIMLRISKPDAKDPTRTRHYEVLIDTPIFLVSDLCNSGNMELPTYDMATNDRFSHEMITGAAPPTFEEAISIPGSPLNSPIVSPVGSPNVRNSFEPDDLYANSFNLSRSASISGSSVLDGSISASVPMNLSSSVDANQRYNNLDGLLSPSIPTKSSDLSGMFTSNFNNIIEENENNPNSGGAQIFKENYSLDKVSNSTSDSTFGQQKNVPVEPANSHRKSSGVEYDPPSYDDIVPLMSDQE